jgi:hypothetical protein
LSLPEHADITAVQCSLCGATFEVAALEPEQRDVPTVAAVPSQSGVTAEQPNSHATRLPERDEVSPGDPLSPGERAALRSAVTWLRIAACLGSGHAWMCVCAPLVALVEPTVAICLAVIDLLVCTIILAGTGGLERLSSRASAVMVCSLSALAALLELLFMALVAWALRGASQRLAGSEKFVPVIAMALSWPVVFLVFLVASIKAFAALRRPAVWHGFRSNER